MYKKTKDLGIFQTEIYRTYVERTIHDMDEIGSLVRTISMKVTDRFLPVWVLMWIQLNLWMWP